MNKKGFEKNYPDGVLSSLLNARKFIPENSHPAKSRLLDIPAN